MLTRKVNDSRVLFAVAFLSMCSNRFCEKPNLIIKQHRPELQVGLRTPPLAQHADCLAENLRVKGLRVRQFSLAQCTMLLAVD